MKYPIREGDKREANLKPVKHQATQVEGFTISGRVVHHEFDSFDYHRIVVTADGAKTPPVYSPWVGYRSIAQIEYNKVVYCGVTDHWGQQFGCPVFAIIKGEII